MLIVPLGVSIDPANLFIYYLINADSHLFPRQPRPRSFCVRLSARSTGSRKTHICTKHLHTHIHGWKLRCPSPETVDICKHKHTYMDSNYSWWKTGVRGRKIAVKESKEKKTWEEQDVRKLAGGSWLHEDPSLISQWPTVTHTHIHNTDPHTHFWDFYCQCLLVSVTGRHLLRVKRAWRVIRDGAFVKTPDIHNWRIEFNLYTFISNMVNLIENMWA